jgi:hypothetical protein
MKIKTSKEGINFTVRIKEEGYEPFIACSKEKPDLLMKEAKRIYAERKHLHKCA